MKIKIKLDLRPGSNCPISANNIAALAFFCWLQSRYASPSYYAATYFPSLNVAWIFVALLTKDYIISNMFRVCAYEILN